MKKLIKNQTIFYVLCGIFSILLITNKVVSQDVSSNIDPNEQHQQPTESETTRQNRALKADSLKEEECPYCNKINEMPMELAEKINEITDMDVFIHDFVDTTNSLSNVSSLDTYPARRRRAATQQARQATCKPIETIVNLIPPGEKDPTVFYFPSCVLAKQCGGCCSHSGTICTPTDETERVITVAKSKFVNQPKLQSMGSISVTIKEHNACKCQCKKTAADCNSLQQFIRSQCRCECLNFKEADSCAQNPKKLFDSNSCACVCRDTKECDIGMQYDQNTCSCQPTTDAMTSESDEEDFTLLHFGDHIHNETYEATDDIKYETEAVTEN